MLSVVGGVGQSQRNGKGDEIDIADIDEELRAVEGEFAKVLSMR